MYPQTESGVLRCASSLRQRYADAAATVVERQIGWSSERGADHEVDFWSAVMERLNETPVKISRIHVLRSERGAARDTRSGPRIARPAPT
ncbi:hypothetical protein GGC65_003963 [Sphingopyxis sp. OAS728]|uniref:hypothetical protein n=1 Tax=Sphingopyxis sp. OAS728 TaxID=2663823 RepID=UPI00178AFF86|nr:hypothetical protein [Sphingopyxis sp. OAS728]MBE1529507.1 hypothetical protein [Sphingopyxis sp. OAS728]